MIGLRRVELGEQIKPVCCSMQNLQQEFAQLQTRYGLCALPLHCCIFSSVG
jgi:hypothetical protein